ncbi:MAG: hypothetical protein AAF385_00245 [Pseudomonadota bacterium]
MNRWIIVLTVLAHTTGCGDLPESATEAEPIGAGPYTVGSTNFEVALEYADIGDDAMHEILLGNKADSGKARFVAEVLKHPESAWLTEVLIPDDTDLYGPASGKILSVATFITFPSGREDSQETYSFPYHRSMYGEFQNMLSPGEEPDFADPQARYPLIIIAHGAEAHGVYDVQHAHDLASHGYIVAVITYGDNRTAKKGEPNFHVSYLRPLLTKSVLDSLLNSEVFGPNIDADNIGISGHSFGGFTTLAIAGGPFQGNSATVSDKRIKAGVIAAPWVGGHYDGSDFFAFGQNNAGLRQVNIPVISFYGTKDDVTLASFILPAMQQLSGPTYVIELVDQPHVFEPGSWEDRNNWELLFFSAYLKHDQASLKTLETATSMRGGNKDIQRLDYQKPTPNSH